MKKIYGYHSVKTLLMSVPERIHELIMLDARDDQRIQTIVELASKNKIRITRQAKDYFERHYQRQTHQGVIAICHEQQALNENDLEEIINQYAQPFLLILDGVQDPHNLGACLRTANAAGVTAVIAPKDRAVTITDTVSKVACGAAEITPFITVTNLARTLRMLKEEGIWLYGLAGEAQHSIYETKLTGSIGLVLGGEEKGLRRLTRECCDDLISIPLNGVVESLNVSVAAAIALYEVVRQRVYICS